LALCFGVCVFFFFFVLTLFKPRWAQAITIMLGENDVVSLVLKISAVVFALAIFGVVMYFAVVVSKTYISLFYFSITIDYADIILSVITLFLALCLLGLIIFVGIKLRGGSVF
jgi:hypothetical protein